MAHDSTKILLGSHGSSDIVSTCENGDPATFIAGLVVRKASTGEISLASGQIIGVSLGISQSDTKKTSVCRAGNIIPIQITDDEDDFAYVVIGQPVEVSATTGKAVPDDVATGAIYVSGPMKGIDPITKAEIDVALIDMGGGL
jgi:hypothetical protein